MEIRVKPGAKKPEVLSPEWQRLLKENKEHADTINYLVKENIFTKESLSAAFSKDPWKFSISLETIKEMGVKEFASTFNQLFTKESLSAAFSKDPWRFSVSLETIKEIGVKEFASTFNQLIQENIFTKEDFSSCFSRYPDNTRSFIKASMGAPRGSRGSFFSHVLSKISDETEIWIRYMFVGWTPEEAERARKEDAKRYSGSERLLENAYNFFSGIKPGDRVVTFDPGTISEKMESAGVLLGYSSISPDGKATHYIIPVPDKTFTTESSAAVSIPAIVKIANSQGIIANIIGAFHTHPSPVFESVTDLCSTEEKARSIAAVLYTLDRRASLYNPFTGRLAEIECLTPPELPPGLRNRVVDEVGSLLPLGDEGRRARLEKILSESEGWKPHLKEAEMFVRLVKADSEVLREIRRANQESKEAILNERLSSLLSPSIRNGFFEKYRQEGFGAAASFIAPHLKSMLPGEVVGRIYGEFKGKEADMALFQHVVGRVEWVGITTDRRLPNILSRIKPVDVGQLPADRKPDMKDGGVARNTELIYDIRFLDEFYNPRYSLEQAARRVADLMAAQPESVETKYTVYHLAVKHPEVMAKIIGMAESELKEVIKTRLETLVTDLGEREDGPELRACTDRLNRLWAIR